MRAHSRNMIFHKDFCDFRISIRVDMPDQSNSTCALSKKRETNNQQQVRLGNRNRICVELL